MSEVPVQGRVVAVTGGARGIGRAIAAALVHRGAKVAIGDLDADAVSRTAEELGCSGHRLDVTDRVSFSDFLEQAEAEHGPLDVLVNNAGVMHVGPFLEEEDATAKLQLDVNVHGTILGMKLALPGMVERHRGHVVNVASAAGKVPVPGEATYVASKHAVVGLTDSMRGELVGTGVELSTVMPAVVDTELAAGFKLTRGAKRLRPEEVADAVVAALEKSRADVFVPASTGPTIAITSLLPRSARERLARFLRVDRVATDADHAARAEYERRIAQEARELESA